MPHVADEHVFDSVALFTAVGFSGLAFGSDSGFRGTWAALAIRGICSGAILTTARVIRTGTFTRRSASAALTNEFCDNGDRMILTARRTDNDGLRLVFVRVRNAYETYTASWLTVTDAFTGTAAHAAAFEKLFSEIDRARMLVPIDPDLLKNFFAERRTVAAAENLADR